MNVVIINESHILFTKEIGEGSFGQVIKAIWCEGGRNKVAVKIIANEKRPGNNVYREANLMVRLAHYRVVHCHGVAERERYCMIVMQFAELGKSIRIDALLNSTETLCNLFLGSLQSYLVKNKDGLSRDHGNLDDICLHVAEGMSWLELNGCVHNDLAARNVLLRRNRRNQIVAMLGDFGLAKDTRAGILSHNVIPYLHTAPELITHRLYSTASDVWSYGVVMWEIYSYGGTPYSGCSPDEITALIDRGGRLSRPRGGSVTVYHIMLNCWKSERKDRPSFSKIVKTLNACRRPF